MPNKPSISAYLDENTKDSSILKKESITMQQNQHHAEEEALRAFGKVYERVIADKQGAHTPEDSLAEQIQKALQHPHCNSQRFDGVDLDLNPEPPLNTDARREYDNAKREQEMEKQLRLGNMPKFRSDPQFKPT